MTLCLSSPLKGANENSDFSVHDSLYTKCGKLVLLSFSKGVLVLARKIELAGSVQFLPSPFFVDFSLAPFSKKGTSL